MKKYLSAIGAFALAAGVVTSAEAQMEKVKAC